MSTATAVDPVAIINDDISERQIWSLLVAEAGFDPVEIEQPAGHPFTSVDELVSKVEQSAKLAVCDHRLSRNGLAQFSGAEAAAALNRRKRTPTLLVTTFVRIDANVSIRQFRNYIPVLLSSEDFQDPDVIRAQFDACAIEVTKGEVPAHRRPWRTLVQIEQGEDESGISVVDALVPGWNTSNKVRFPLVLIDPQLWKHVKTGARFFARVNIGAQRDEDLFFENFELAPDPNPNDGLA